MRSDAPLPLALSGSNAERRSVGSQLPSMQAAHHLWGKAPSASPQLDSRMTERTSWNNCRTKRKVSLIRITLKHHRISLWKMILISERASLQKRVEFLQCHLEMHLLQKERRHRGSEQSQAGLTPSRAATLLSSSWCGRALSVAFHILARWTHLSNGSSPYAWMISHQPCSARRTSRPRTQVRCFCVLKQRKCNGTVMLTQYPCLPMW